MFFLKQRSISLQDLINVLEKRMSIAAFAFHRKSGERLNYKRSNAKKENPCHNIEMLTGINKLTLKDKCHTTNLQESILIQYSIILTKLRVEQNGIIGFWMTIVGGICSLFILLKKPPKT
jgi:hypothetical protein